jgi:hypothetical protein
MPPFLMSNASYASLRYLLPRYKMPVIGGKVTLFQGERKALTGRKKHPFLFLAAAENIRSGR